MNYLKLRPGVTITRGYSFIILYIGARSIEVLNTENSTYGKYVLGLSIARNLMRPLYLEYSTNIQQTMYYLTAINEERVKQFDQPFNTVLFSRSR